MTLAAGTKLGSYVVTSSIGAGGMGEVYLATDTTLDRQAALKILPEAVLQDPDRLARFEREAKSLAALNHPNIAQVYGVLHAGQDGTASPAIAMEFVPGQDLSEIIARGPVAVDEALRIARQVAAALEAAHGAGIIHRDLKPANIRLRPDGVVKVLDFGLAKASDPNDVSGVSAMNSPTLTARATELGVILGTAAYMAPEQAKGRATDRRVDVWAFGVVLYEMLTGRRAFSGDDVTEVMAAVIRDTPSLDLLPEATPPGVRRLLRRCLEKDAAKRARDMGDAGLELDEAMAGARDEIAPAGVSESRSRPSTAALIGVALALAAVASAAGWWLKPVPVEDRPVVRFGIPLPVGVNVTGTAYPAIAISPDGRRTAYITTRGIFVRDLAAAEPRVLSSSAAGNNGIAFSPDGEWLAWASTAGLAKLPTAGGPAQMLDSDVDGAGVSWTPDGRILVGSGSGVLAIADIGGKAEVLLSVPGGALRPQLLPDGRHVLYTTYGNGLFSTQVQPVDGGAAEVVLENASGAFFVPSGHVLFGREGQTWAVPFDPDALEVRGSPVPLGDSIFVSGASGLPQVAVSDNGTTVMLPADQGEEDLALVWADASGNATPAFSEPRRYSDPRLSPDGRRVALHLWDEENDIWIADLQRQGLTRITFDPAEDETPVWSPDGRYVAYSADRTGQPRTVFRKRVDGNASEPEEIIWQSPEHSHVTDWSPDGRIIVQLGGTTTSDDILAIDVETKEVTPLLASPFSERQGRVSPDGRWLAYTSSESGRPEVFVQAYPSLGARATVSTNGGVEPVWSRDSKRLFFRSDEDIMVASVVSSDPLELTTPAVLFPDRFVRTQGDNHIHFDLAPDGRLLLIGYPDSGREAGPREGGRLMIAVNWLEELKQKLPAR